MGRPLYLAGKVETDAVKRMHAAGKLPSVRLFEPKLMFDVKDLDQVIEAAKR